MIQGGGIIAREGLSTNDALANFTNGARLYDKYFGSGGLTFFLKNENSDDFISVFTDDYYDENAKGYKFKDYKTVKNMIMKIVFLVDDIMNVNDKYAINSDINSVKFGQIDLEVSLRKNKIFASFKENYEKEIRQQNDIFTQSFLRSFEPLCPSVVNYFILKFDNLEDTQNHAFFRNFLGSAELNKNLLTPLKLFWILIILIGNCDLTLS